MFSSLMPVAGSKVKHLNSLPAEADVTSLLRSTEQNFDAILIDSPL